MIITWPCEKWPNALRFSKKIIVFNFPILAESLKDASWIRHLVLLLEEVQLFYYSEKEKKSPYREERTMWSKNKNILANISHRSLDTALIKIWEIHKENYFLKCALLFVVSFNSALVYCFLLAWEIILELPSKKMIWTHQSKVIMMPLLSNVPRRWSN